MKIEFTLGIYVVTRKVETFSKEKMILKFSLKK